MDLKDFIRTTLVQIAEGVEAAQDAVGSVGGAVNIRRPSGSVQTGPGQWWRSLQIVQAVEFDVALEATTGEGGAKGAGLAIAGVFGGAKRTTTESESSLSRVKFMVPLTLPEQQLPDPE